VNTRIEGLKTLRQKWSAELEQLQRVDGVAAQHWREALEDLDTIIRHLQSPVLGAERRARGIRGATGTRARDLRGLEGFSSPLIRRYNPLKDRSPRPS
jgi:hypothetical protein